MNKTRNYKISVVMPVYNCQEYLEEAIDSILEQTFGDFELLIINDGSTDNTINRILKYSDPRIRLLHNKHNFIDSLNKGIREAAGKYIARMDADDIMHPKRLAIQYQIMEKHPDIAVCASWFRIFGQITGENKYFNNYISKPLLWLLKGNFIAHPTIMMRKSFLQENNLFYEAYPYAEDYKLWSRIAECRGQFWMIPEFLLNYRTSFDQVSQKKRKEQDINCSLIKNEILEYLIAHAGREKENIARLSENINHFSKKNLLSQDCYFQLFFDLFSNLGY